LDDIPPVPGAVVPDCPMVVPDFPVAPAPVPAGGVDGWVGEPGCVADGAAGALGVLLPPPVFGALPVIAPTIARVAMMLMTCAMGVCLLGATRSVLIGRSLG
jgi:hypothetical protein